MSVPLRADPLRLGFWHVELSRRGPGVLLADILKGEDQVDAVIAGLVTAQADVLVLAGVDYDRGLVTLRALRDAVQAAGGPDYPHLFAPFPNTGMDTGLDLNGDGDLGGPDDAQGYGPFAGEGALAVLSRFPLTQTADHSARLWRDMPDSLFVDHRGQTGAGALGAGVQRLSTVAHVELSVAGPTTHHAPLTLMIFHATPPVFDGPEDRNGRRNHDEILFWRHRLDGTFGPPPDLPVIVGVANLSPHGGDGRIAAIRTLLDDPRLTDPPGLRGRTTADWPPPGPGKKRVDYILPSAELAIIGSGVAAADPHASRHQLIWVDLDHAAARAGAASGN